MGLHPDVERVALLGWRLHPCSSVSKAACFKDFTDQSTSDLDTLERWSQEYPNCGWRVVFEGSGIWALDCDRPPHHEYDGVEGMRLLCEKHGGLPPRPVARTGNGGLVLFFKDTGERLRGDPGHPCLGVDPKRGRLNQTIPPSKHPKTSGLYRWIVPPWELEPPAAPEWLLRRMREPVRPERERVVFASDDEAVRAAVGRAQEYLRMATNGERNHQLNRSAFKLSSVTTMSCRQIIEVLYPVARSLGLLDVEILATIKSGVRAGERARKW